MGKPRERDFGVLVSPRPVTPAIRAWIALWNMVGWRILRLPPDVQQMLLADLHTAVENRLKVMEDLCRT